MALEDDDGGEQEAVGAGDGGGKGRRSRTDSVGGRRRKKGDILGSLLSRVKPRPRTKDPFIPGGGSTRDKRCFWAGRENSHPAAHL